MITRTLGEIAQLVDGRLVNGSASTPMRGVSKDTRTIEPGQLYVPLIGQQFDGHQYVEEAHRRGAAASFWKEGHGQPPEHVPLLFVDDPLAAMQRLAKWYRTQLGIRVIGITGSNGKTTTKDMVAAVLSGTYRVHKTKGNLNGDIGLPLTILEIDEQVEYVVLEMGMRGFGEIELLSEIAQPDAAIITMIGEAHLERLGSREGIARAKLEIRKGLRPDGCFICSGDEPLLADAIAEEKQRRRTVSFGFGSHNDLIPMRIETTGSGIRFALQGEEDRTYTVAAYGEHNVSNALAAIAAGRLFGVPDAQIAQQLETMQVTDMRLERIDTAQGVTIINDAFNASPTSVRASLAFLGQWQGAKRKLVVLGDMMELGSEELELHREIGALVTADQFDYLFAIGERSKQIAAGSTLPADRVQWCADHAALVEAVARLAQPQDVILVKGSRGMKLEQVVDQWKARFA